MAYDKIVDSSSLDSGLTSIANAIRTKGGTSADLAFPTGFVNAIGAIPTGGGGGVEEKDVNFFDYDGTLLHSYTKAEFALLSALPANPSHEGLTAQGWNWSLSDAQSYVADCGGLDIGQTYVPSDGHTKIYIEIPNGTPSIRRKATLMFGLSSANSPSVEVDWGDNTAKEEFTSTTVEEHTHTYASVGKYTITVTNLSGTSIGGSSSGLFGSVASGTNGAIMRSLVYGVAFGSDAWSLLPGYILQYAYALKFAVISSSTTYLRTSVFSGCYALRAFVFHSSLKSLANGLDWYGSFFENCYNLERVSLSKATTGLGTGVFTSCYNLTRVYIGTTANRLGSNTFSNCRQITKLTIPASIANIAKNSFASMYCLSEVHMKGTTPPTLAGAAFASPTDIVIFVPYSADHSVLNAYKTASQWSNYASQMQEEPQ